MEYIATFNATPARVVNHKSNIHLIFNHHSKPKLISKYLFLSFFQDTNSQLTPTNNSYFFSQFATMPDLETTGNPRKLDDTGFSPRKETKKLCVVSETDAEKALDASMIKDLLKDQGLVLASMGPYVEELTDSKTSAKEPREFLKVLLMEGYMDENGLVTSNDNEKSLI